MTGDWFKIPNLISIGRIFLLLPIGYFLSRPGVENHLYALACLTAAAISDLLDGYLARRLNQQTKLGLVLDPLSDKIMAAVLVVLLIIYREFPLWLAAVIIGRDLLIMMGSLWIKTKTSDIPASNLSGKYAFTAIAVLLISYVIEYDFGIWLFTTLTILLAALSLAMYTCSFVIVLKGGNLPQFADRPLWSYGRRIATWLISIAYFYYLFVFIDWI